MSHIESDPRFAEALEEYADVGGVTSNPFQYGFAVTQETQDLIGRQSLVNNAIAILDAPVAPDDCTMFFGARGSGKTSTMMAIAAEARRRGWLVIETDGTGDGDGLLDGLSGAIADAFEQSSVVGACDELIIDSDRSLSSADERPSDDSESRSWEATPLRVLRDIGKNVGRRKDVPGVLLMVDELGAASESDCINLGNALQDMIRRKRYPLQFRGASLPEFRRGPLTHRDLSFFRRCASVHLLPITRIAARGGFQRYAALNEGAFESDALDLASSSIHGSPYMFQLVGHMAWKASQAPECAITLADVQHGVEAASKLYTTDVEESTWRGLSDQQQDAVLHVFGSPTLLTRDALLQWAAEQGMSRNRRRELLADLITDNVLVQQKHSDLIQIMPGCGLTAQFLQDVLVEVRRDEEEGKRSIGFELPDDERSSAAGPSRAATPTTRSQAHELCNRWMRKSKARCVLPLGHTGHCRSKRTR